MVAGISTVAPVARLPRAVLDRLSPRHRAEEVTVAVDPGRCGSFGFCEQEAPGIFTLRSDQRLAYRSVVASDQAEAAMRAAVVCPARAIKLGRLPATVVVSQPGADTSTVSPLAATLTPHTGSQAAVADPHAGSLARMAAAVDPGTGSHPRVSATDTGSFPRVATGPQPRASATDTGSFPRVAGGPQPRVSATDSGSFPGVPADTGRSPLVPGTDAGSYPPAAQPRVAGVDPHTGPQPGLRPLAANGPAGHRRSTGAAGRCRRWARGRTPGRCRRSAPCRRTGTPVRSRRCARWPVRRPAPRSRDSGR